MLLWNGGGGSCPACFSRRVFPEREARQNDTPPWMSNLTKRAPPRGHTGVGGNWESMGSQSGHTVAIVRAEVTRFLQLPRAPEPCKPLIGTRGSKDITYCIKDPRVLDRGAAQFDRGMWSTLFNPTRIVLSRSAPCSN
jgi:hypothetical protein